MASPIAEIVTELAAQNPGITSEQITEIIINSIESEPMISGVISRIQVPTRSQIKQAEFISSKFRKKNRDKILARIENAYFFRNLQLRYITPIQGSDLRQSIHRDGARVDLSSPIKYSDSSYQRFDKTWHLDKTHEAIQSVEDTPTPIEYLHSIITKEVSAQNTKETEESPSDTLQEIHEGFEASTYLLSLYNIYQITRTMETMETSHNQVDVLNKVFSILSDDIKRRNKLYRTDCIGELYRGDDSLPEEQQVHHPSSSSISDRINQSLKAIIVHEYKRVHTQYGQHFINNQITYDTYIQATDRYSLYADKLFSELST